MSHIDPCYEYRLRREDESPEDYGLRAANLLEAELLRVGPENVMAFAAEPVVGATAGALTAAPDPRSRKFQENSPQIGYLFSKQPTRQDRPRVGP